MKIFKRLLVVLTILFIMSCNCNTQEVYINHEIPKTCRNIRDLGNRWCVFTIGNKTFLHHWYCGQEDSHETVIILPEDFNLGN